MNYYLMSKNIIVAKVKDDKSIHYYKKELVPLLLRITNDIDLWLENRAIDRHRPSSRILRKMLRLTNSSELDVVLKFNAVSLTDTYWMKPTNSPMTWEEAIKCTDYFSELIINGKIDLYEDYHNRRTFELTNVGSYEKCWRKDLKTDDWYLVKKQKIEEVESEMIAYKVAKLLNIPVAEYNKLSDTLIECKNFIHNWDYNFEDAFSIVGEEEDAAYNMEQLGSLKDSLLLEYTYMKILDAIIMNVDRHTRNYGILRNVDTGDIISMAPMYDYNLCLSANKSILRDKSPKLYFDEVKECLDNLNGKYKIKLPMLKEEDFSLSSDTKLNKFIWNNYKEISSLIKNQK